MQSDFAIERQLTSTLGLTLSYIWSRGVQYFTVRDLNMGPLFNDYVTYQVASDPAGQNIGRSYATRVYRSKNDRRYNQILFLDNGGQTWYNAFVAQSQKRFSHGFQASVAYTYSHAIDDFNQGGGSNVVIPESAPFTTATMVSRRELPLYTSATGPPSRGSGRRRFMRIRGGNEHCQRLGAVAVDYACYSAIHGAGC